MDLPRKIFISTARITSLVAISLFTASTALAQEAAKEKRVVMRALDGKYISAAASGGLDLIGQAAKDKTGFVIIDANGGELADGDGIKIKYTPGYSSDAGKNKPSFWVEEADKIKRVNDEPQGAAGKFTLKKQGEGFLLQTEGGKFVAAPKEGGLGLADTPEGGLVLKIEEQPVAK